MTVSFECLYMNNLNCSDIRIEWTIWDNASASLETPLTVSNFESNIVYGRNSTVLEYCPSKLQGEIKLAFTIRTHSYVRGSHYPMVF